MGAELDDMLRRYLQREEEDPIRKRLEHQADWMAKHEKEDADRHGQLLRALDGHNFRIGTLEQKAGELAEEVESTGQHNIEALQNKHKRVEDLGWGLAKMALAAVLGGGVFELIHRVSGH